MLLNALFLAHLLSGWLASGAAPSRRSAILMASTLGIWLYDGISLSVRNNHQVLRYQDIRGKQQEKPAWRALLHFFNHQTHHRGQVSVLLDQMSVTNDFSNLIWKF
jgi:uncharacterized damage-inducible protein DinB